MAIDPDVQVKLDSLVVDGVTLVKPGDDLQAAFDEQPYIVQLAPGDHHWDGSKSFPGSDPVPDLIGYGPGATRVFWEADGGTVLIGGAKGNQRVKGIQFQAGSGKPDCWFDNTASVQDWGSWIEECYFGSWNRDTGTAAIKLGNNVNAHLSKIRFGGGKGPAILATGKLGSFVLDRFTIDTSSTPDGVFGGLLRVDWRGGQKMVVEISNGRVEATGREYAPPHGLVHIHSDRWTPAPVMVHLRSLDVDLSDGITIPHALVAVTADGVTGHFNFQNIKTWARPEPMVPVSGVAGTPHQVIIGHGDDIISYLHGTQSRKDIIIP